MVVIERDIDKIKSEKIEEVTTNSSIEEMIKLETLQSVIPILKFYYIDIVVGFMLFFGGIGIGIGLGARIVQKL